MKWRHFSALLPICAGISPVPGEFPTQRSVTRNFDVFFDLRLNKRLSGAGDLRRYRAHYDVTLMKAIRNLWCKNSPHRSLYCQWLGETSIIKIHPVLCFTWWLHQMETFSALLDLCEGNSLITGEFPSQRSVTGSFGVFFDLRLNKRFSKQSRRRRFETPSRSLWCPGPVLMHCGAPAGVTTFGNGGRLIYLRWLYGISGVSSCCCWYMRWRQISLRRNLHTKYIWTIVIHIPFQASYTDLGSSSDLNDLTRQLSVIRT